MGRFDCTMYVTNLYFLFDFVVVLLGFHFVQHLSFFHSIIPATPLL